MLRLLLPRTGCALVSALVFAGSALMASTERPPNILLIFADDLGWTDLPSNGSDFYETPQLDKLAAQGMTFSNAYAAAGNCAPSRAALHSGQYSPRQGVYAVGNTHRGSHALQRLIPVPNREDLALEKITIGESLAAAGYTTALFGKWHLDGDSGTTPEMQGYPLYFNPRPDPNPRRDEPEDPKAIFSITRAAMDFMTENRDRPFFAFVSHYAIHSALEWRPSSLEKFEAKKKGRQHDNPKYAACIYDLDESVGMLLAKLDELGLAEDTIVVFTSDNGATQQSPQEPLRGNKGGYYEGGIREPMMVRWPGHVAAGSVSDAPVINIDFYPTFLDLAGAAAPMDYPLDGESLVPLFTQQGDLSRPAIFWHFPGYLDKPVIRGRDPIFRTRPVTVIRKGDWKLHFYHEEWVLDGGAAGLPGNHAVELYNLADDVGEHHDLAATQIAKRDELIGDVLHWFADLNVPLPTEPNPDFDPAELAAQTKKALRKLAGKK